MTSTRTSLVDPGSAVSVSRQLELLRIPRSSYYHRPRGRKRKLEGEERELLRTLDRIFDKASVFMSRGLATFCTGTGVSC